MSDEPENDNLLNDALKSYGLKSDIARIHNEMMQTMKPVKRSAPVRRMFPAFSRIAAAVLVMLIGAAVFLYFNTTSQNLFDTRYQPYEQTPQRGSNEQSSETRTRFIKGQDFLREGDPANAILSFAAVLEQNARSSEKILNDDAEYYLALSYLENDQPDNALPLFEKINKTASHLYHDQVSDWFLMRVKIAAWKNR